ncbi:MAG TPA: MATE family efflux transporter, partial [Sorangium sp.]|nr:MATE family efflux transporter [Sorangium sp.]
AVRETLYGQGDTKTPMRAALTANVLNIGLDALFILQLGWGARGAALASALAAAAELVPLCATRRGRALLSQVYSGGVRRQALANVREVWRLGLPLGLQLFLSVSVFALLTGAFAMMGKNDVAAHQVALQVIHVSFLPAYALGEAVSVLVGQAVGAGEDDLVTSVARQALFAAALYTGACGVLFAVTARLIAGLFARDPQLIDLIVQLLYVGAAFQVFDGANIVAGSVLRGVGDVSFAAWISVGSAWLITPVITYLLGFRAGLGVVGGWFGFVVELLLAAVVLWWRLERGGWLPAAAAERAKLHAQQPQTTLEPSLPRHLTNNATQ